MIDFTKINNDVNGGPRYVCHYLDFAPYTPPSEPWQKFEYSEALQMAKSLGGRKFHNKQYGGGIVFQSYNIQGLSDKIEILTGHAIECHRPPTAGEIKRGHGATHYRTFDRELLTRRDGELKNWFKADDGLNYSRL